MLLTLERADLQAIAQLIEDPSYVKAALQILFNYFNTLIRPGPEPWPSCLEDKSRDHNNTHAVYTYM